MSHHDHLARLGRSCLSLFLQWYKGFPQRRRDHGFVQDDAPVNLDVVEAVVAAARRRPVPPRPDTKVSLDAFLKGLVIVSTARFDEKSLHLLLRRKMK